MKLYRWVRTTIGFRRPGPVSETLQPTLSTGSRSGYLAKCFFEGLGYEGQKITHFQKHNCCFGLAAEGGKTNKQLVS